MSHKVYYYHTHNNRRTRRFDFSNIDFNRVKLTSIALDKVSEDDMEDIEIPAYA